MTSTLPLTGDVGSGHGNRSTSLTAMFAPRGIAVVGASRNPDKLGAAMARSLAPFAAAGGHLALVNGRDDTMHPNLRTAAAHGPVDLAMICVPAAACPGVLAEAAAAGVGAAVISGGGFAEAGGPGVGYQQELTEVVAATGIRLLGPNTSGFLAPHVELTASFVPGAREVCPGRVAVVAASGGVNHALVFLLADAGHGVSLAVGLGNGVDVTAADVLDHLADDPATSAIALHVESVPDGRRLVESVRRVSARRPVVALVVGRHDVSEFAASHTGALATSWRTTRAALAQAGAVVVEDERELVDAVGALSTVRALPAADVGIGVVTAQAGPGLLLLDDLRGRRLRVPALAGATRSVLSELLPPLTFQGNPVDTGRPGPHFAGVLKAVADDPQVDVVAVYALHEPAAVDLVATVQAGRTDGVPVVVGLGGAGEPVRADRRALLERGVPVLPDARGVANATAALAADARSRALAAKPPPPADPSGLTIAAGWYDEDRAKAVLNTLGITTSPRRACADRVAARAALNELGGPVAVKLLDAQVLHKTEIGGVHLGIRTPEQLENALDALEHAGARRFLVESMADDGVDLVVGARRDPVFGPVVLVGLGGTTAEALEDVSIRLAPLSAGTAARMPADLAGHALLTGWRGGPELDPDGLGHVISALGNLLAANPDVSEIEINPLRVTRAGLVALDAVLVTENPENPVEEVGEDAEPRH